MEWERGSLGKGEVNTEREGIVKGNPRLSDGAEKVRLLSGGGSLNTEEGPWVK